ncbi:MAG: hypothetical protein SPI35_03595 [Porphyromonas sp.]|nr:hypothetical protein [Porphyromonas sp.]
MTLKRFFLSAQWTVALSLLCLLFSCKETGKGILEAPKPIVEDVIKGHDEWNKIEIILRMAKKSDDGKYLLAYDEGKYNSILPVKQVITLGRSGGGTGSVEITSPTKHFTVLKGKDLYYTLEMCYFDRHGKSMNYQFCVYPERKDAQMLPIHQHFFVIAQTNFFGKEAYPTDLAGNDIEELHYTTGKDGKRRGMYAKELQKKSRSLFEYFYRDTDPVDAMIGSSYTDPQTGKTRTVDFIRKKRSLDPSVPYDRVGLKGYFNFKRSDIAYHMQIDLVHVIPGDKYIGKDPSNGNLLEFDERHPAWSVTDVTVKLPFRVIADADAGVAICAQQAAKELKIDAPAIQQMLSNPIQTEPDFRL